jgi:hypothetical protein
MWGGAIGHLLLGARQEHAPAKSTGPASAKPLNSRGSEKKDVKQQTMRNSLIPVSAFSVTRILVVGLGSRRLPCAAVSTSLRALARSSLHVHRRLSRCRFCAQSFVDQMHRGARGYKIYESGKQPRSVMLFFRGLPDDVPPTMLDEAECEKFLRDKYGPSGSLFVSRQATTACATLALSFAAEFSNTPAAQCWNSSSCGFSYDLSCCFVRQYCDAFSADEYEEHPTRQIFLHSLLELKLGHTGPVAHLKSTPGPFAFIGWLAFVAVIDALLGLGLRLLLRWLGAPRWRGSLPASAVTAHLLSLLHSLSWASRPDVGLSP